MEDFCGRCRGNFGKLKRCYGSLPTMGHLPTHNENKKVKKKKNV
jgi:hypothetical protein